MKLIIDIPKDIIEGAKSSPNYYPAYHFEKIWRVIAKGIPLPKGHGRLIDADALNEAYTYECISECDCCEHCSKDGHGCELLLNAPTIIEADVPKRRKGTPLEENDSGYNCKNWIP